MDHLPFTPPNQAIPRRRGRPPGARNKRSIDLARYVEAQFSGSTPGQQAAQLCLVTQREIRESLARCADFGIAHPPKDPFTRAMVVKAAELAQALGCDRRDAWLLLQKEREGLMAYIHPKQAQAAPQKPGERALAYIVPEGRESDAPLLELGDSDDIEILGEFSPAGDQVANPKSPDVT
jgi:hypothetical protein